MQPLQCALHPRVAEHQGGTDYARNDRSRTRRAHKLPFIAGCSHFTPKNLMFRAPASSPTQVPCNIPAAITMCFEAPCTHPCSHYNALCIHALQNTKEEPIRLETIAAAPAAHKLPFVASCSHFTRKSTRFHAPASSSTQAPGNIHAAIARSTTDTSMKQHHFPQSPPFVITTSFSHHHPS